MPSAFAKFKASSSLEAELLCMIQHGASRRSGDSLRGVNDLLREPFGPVRKLRQAHLEFPEKGHHSPHAAKQTDRSPKADSVKATQDAVDVILVPFDKLMHGATPVWFKGEFGLTPSLYPQALRFSLSGSHPGRSGGPLLSSQSGAFCLIRSQLPAGCRRQLF